MINGIKLIKICGLEYKILHSFDEDLSTTFEDIICDSNNEMFKKKLDEAKTTHLYIVKFENNRLIETITTVFTPMNLSEQERVNSLESDYNWDLDIPF